MISRDSDLVLRALAWLGLNVVVLGAGLLISMLVGR